MTSQESTRARFGPFEVDLHTHELWKFGTRLKLVGQPFEILAVLLRKPGELVTREELHSRLWPADTFVDFNHGLNAAVNKLREALSDSADNPRYVETLPRRGYRFIATIEWIDSKPASAAVPVPADPPPATSPDPPDPPPPPLQGATSLPAPILNRRIGYAMAIGVCLVGMFLGVYLLQSWYGRVSPAAARSVAERTRPLTPLVGTASPSFSPDGNSVAFYRHGAQKDESGIFVSAVGGDQFLQLTHNEDDCCPVWSPDGRSIAFSRFANKEISIYIVPADGGAEQKRKKEVDVHFVPAGAQAERTLTADGPANAASAAYTLTIAATSERKLDTNGIAPRHGEIDWSPDGKSIAFSGGAGIYVLSLENSSVHRLTESPPTSEDWGPTFSPDGRKLLFVRNREISLPNEIWVASTTGGDPVRLLTERGRIVSPPQWSFDGRSLIFSSNRSGHPALWRASLDTPDSIIQIDEAGSPAWDPVVSRRGYRLAYERIMRSLSIWQLDLSSQADRSPQVLVSATSDTDQGPAPQFSPDGKKLAYMSDRTGTMEIWVSNRDGSSPFQLTAVGGAGTPRWSPDSQSVVFDTTTSGPKIVTINLRGGPPQVLSPENISGQCPSWSHDGKWIYFASEHSGDREVWKVPSAGGAPLQLTHQGGHAALESPDGRTLYYAKNSNAEPEIWQVPVDGGAETPVPLVRPGTWASWQVVNGGILFVGPSLGHQAVLSFYDFASRRTTTVTVLNRTPFWLGATPDGRTVAFDQPGREQDQAMLVDNFR